MHFTLWPGLFRTTGSHGEISWGDFLDFLSHPTVAESKGALEGWSPGLFKANHRAVKDVEAMSLLGLDFDTATLTTDALAAHYAPFAGALHTTFSHTPDAPRHRVVLRLSRDVTAEEYYRLWSWARAAAPGPVDEATKDPSRFWYVPAHPPGGAYAWCELAGAAVDVDAILTSSAAGDREEAPKALGVAPDVHPAPGPVAGGARRQAMAAALAAAWPPKGQRHAAQLALAGALRAEGFAEAEAVDFLVAVAGDRPKREATVRHTYDRPADAPTTGWQRLKSYVDPVVVDAARRALGRDADFSETVARRIELAAAHAPPAIVEVPGDEWGVIDWDTIDPPIEWIVSGIVQEATVSIAFGKPNSLKTWALYSIAGAVATGTPWLGRFPVHQGLVVIVDYESSARQARRRMRLLRALGLTGKVKYVNPAGLTDEALWEKLASLRPVLVVVDSLSRGMLGEDENSVAMAAPLATAKHLARICGTASVFIHHKNKGGGDGFEGARGSTAIMAAAEGWLDFTDFEKDDISHAQRVTLRCDRLKESVGFDDIRLELSDARGLVEIAGAPASPEPTKRPNRELVLGALATHSSGVAKSDLVALMDGKREKKFEVLAQLKLASLTVEYRAEGKDFVMLNPNLAKT